jgi:hypothetical protein
MRWSRRGADRLLQVRCAGFNGKLGSSFGQLFQAVDPATELALAAWPPIARHSPWRNPLVGYETLAMMRKGQVKGIGGNDIVAQAAFVNSLFDMAAWEWPKLTVALSRAELCNRTPIAAIWSQPTRQTLYLTQQLERKYLTLRTRIKRLVRKTICFSMTIEMHDTVIGLFINRYEFGRTV